MEIKGNGFTLRSWRTEDASALHKHANNPKISACLLDRFPSPYTLADAETFIAMKSSEQVATNFAIDIHGEVAGVAGLDFRQDVYRKTPLLGYWIAEPYWGRGIITEAIKLITKYAFDNLDVICITAYVLSKNPKSMRVLEKAGYEKQGVIRQSVIKGGEVLDEHIFTAHR